MSRWERERRQRRWGRVRREDGIDEGKYRWERERGERDREEGRGKGEREREDLGRDRTSAAAKKTEQFAHWKYWQRPHALFQRRDEMRAILITKTR